VSQQAGFDGMPEPGALRRIVEAGHCVVVFGRSVVYRYDVDDVGMRNLAIVALTDAGRRVDEVAVVFGLTATYVSILRGRAAQQGSAGLVRRRGRPAKLDARKQAQAQRWSAQGRSQQWIADRFGVARSLIGRVLAELGPAPVQPPLSSQQGASADAEHADAEQGTTKQGTTGVDQAPIVEVTDELAEGELPASDLGAAGSARIGLGSYRCRYAGAMLLHAYLDRIGAQEVFATVTGGPARRYDDLAVLSTATLGFALGIDTVEGAKHLRRAEAGVTVGLSMIPELRTFRTRLGALADGSDPLALQRAFARQMLAFDPPGSPVYYVDDHFVAYSGTRPVAKGYNTRRRLAEPGRADTLVCDSRGRAVAFAAGEPSGLTRTMPTVLAQLREVTGPDAPILLGFDRGGSYPAAFTACRQAGMDWLTYRRGALMPTTAPAHRSWTVRDGRRVYLTLIDENVELTGYGQARQLTLIQDGLPVLQVLTTDTGASGAALLCWLRARWRIENLFKYASDNNGINALADYDMTITTNTALVPNPARRAARAVLAQAEQDLATTERSLAQLLAGPGSPEQMNAALPDIHRKIAAATRGLEQAKLALAPIPAKLAANILDPNAQRARPRLERRGLQMVLRLLAFNAEAWLAEHLNTYLADPNEYRATLRHLLHQGGSADYTDTAITVTLDRPDTPRIARALAQLTEELNTQPAHLPGDRRPMTYQIAAT